MGPCYGNRKIESFEINDQIRYLSEEIDALDNEKNSITGKNHNM